MKSQDDTEPRERGNGQSLNVQPACEPLSRPESSTLAATHTPSEPSESKSVSDRKAGKIALKEEIRGQLEGLVADALGDVEGLGKALEGLIDRVCSSSPPLARVKLAKLFCVALDGQTWGKALEDAGISWCSISGLRGQNPAFAALVDAVLPVADAACARRRLKLADRRAFEGIDVPAKGGGTYKLYSDRLAELLIKGDDPGRYNPQQSKQAPGSSGGPVAVQININTGPANSPSIQTSAFTVSNPDNP